MEFTRVDIRAWSMLGQKGTFGWTLERLAKENEKIIGLTGDFRITSGMDRFATEYPDRFINAGIAEQDMIGVAAGIADAGYIPFVTTHANFSCLRACEMMRHFMGYMKSNVKIIGLFAGLSLGTQGNTHYGLEDVAAIRSIPNIVILSPADGMEVVKCTEAAALCDKPVYIRFTGVMNQPMIHRLDFDFKIGKAYTISEGEDVILLATGTMVAQSCKAVKILSDQGISVKLVDVSTIKPFDESVLDEKQYKLAITVEEHSIVGGLGSTVAEALSARDKSYPLVRLGVSGDYRKAGDYAYMLDQYGLTPESIANSIIKRLETISK